MLSLDGKTVAYSDFSGKLKLLDRDARKVSILSESGSMLDLAFTGDSRTVVFRESSYDNNHRRLVSVKAADVATGRQRCLAVPSRGIEAVDVRGASALTVDAGRAKVSAAAGKEVEKAWPVLSFERGLLYIVENGERRLASPLGTEGMSYIWAEISPDGKRMLFFAAGYGTYTCNLDGSDLNRLGYIYAPVWYGNDIVVGMQTKNDGVVTYEGRIVASDYKGTTLQTLTEPNLVAVLPQTAPGRISFTTTDGELYIMNIRQ